MQPTTIRRLLVLGVCALGVGCLYLVPLGGRFDDVSGTPAPGDTPTIVPAPPVSAGSGPATGSPGTRTQPVSARTGSAPDARPTARSTATAPPTRTVRTVSARPASATTRTAGRATPGATDHEAPDTVRRVSATPQSDRLQLRWDAATDNVRVVGYRVWLNDFAVASTTETHVEVRWFNDDTTTHVVEVRAVDEAGNQSRDAALVMVDRPADPSPTPEPSTAAGSATPGLTAPDQPTESPR